MLRRAALCGYLRRPAGLVGLVVLRVVLRLRAGLLGVEGMRLVGAYRFMLLPVYMGCSPSRVVNLTV